jgi:hypothetical protein
MTLDSSGNLGLGVTPSASNLPTIQSTYGIFVGNSESNITSNAYYNSGWKYVSTAAATEYRQGGGAHQWNIAASGTAGDPISFTTAMTLDASGNLGVGTTSPAYRLDVQASGNTLARIGGSGTGQSGLILTSGGAFSPFINFISSTSTTEAGIYALAGSAALVFTTGSAGTERARIDSSGNLLVGTTSTSVANGAMVYLPGTGNGYLALGHATGTGSGTYYTTYEYAGTIIGGVTQNGTTGVLYNLTSDYRLKNNPQALTGAKDFVMALQPKKWQWWDGSGEGVGFIAHEFMEVAKYSGNGMKDAVDEEGKPIMQSIQPSSSEVMANLVSLIQEQQAMIESLRQRLSAANL